MNIHPTFILEEENPLKRLGMQCRRLRLYLGLSQENLAEKINKSPKSIQNIENAKNRVSVETLSSLCDVLGLDPRVYFCPHTIDTPDYLLDLNQLVAGCTEEEARIITRTIATMLQALREKESSK